MTKNVVRWLRSVTQYNADPEHKFMEFVKWWQSGDRYPSAVEQFQTELEFCTVHYFTHLLQSLAVVNVKCPSVHISNQAGFLYNIMVDLLHLNAETKDQLEARLKP